MAERINTEAFHEKVLESEKPVIADFYSDSCVPCKKLSPTLSKVEKAYEGQIKAVKINVLYDGEAGRELWSHVYTDSAVLQGRRSQGKA